MTDTLKDQIAQPGHVWVERFGLTCCKSCGYVRNAGSDRRACKGRVRIALRSPPLDGEGR